MNHLVIITPDSRMTDFKYYYENDSLVVINDLITTFDTGVSNVRIVEIGMNDLAKILPKPIPDDILKRIKTNFSYENQSEYDKREQEYLEVIEGLDEERASVIGNFLSAQEDLWMDMFDKIYQQGMIDCVDTLKSLYINPF